MRQWFGCRRIVAVVGKRVVRSGDSGVRMGWVARFARHWEGDDPGHVPLQREHLQIEHEAGMVGIRGGNADGAVQIRQRMISGVGLGLLDAAINLEDRR